MLAREDENLQSAVCTVARLTKEEKIRLQCEAREDYYRRTAGRERLLKETTAKLDQTTAKLEQALELLRAHGIDPSKAAEDQM